MMQNLWRQGLLYPVPGQLSCQHRQRMLQVDHGVEPGAEEVWRAHDPNPSGINSPQNDSQVIRLTSFTPDRKHSCGSSGFCRADYKVLLAARGGRVPCQRGLVVSRHASQAATASRPPSSGVPLPPHLRPRRTSRGAGDQMHLVRVKPRVLSNPSFEARPNGKPPGPGHRYGVHFLGPGPGGLPSVPPQLKR